MICYVLPRISYLQTSVCGCVAAIESPANVAVAGASSRAVDVLNFEQSFGEVD